LEQFGTDGRPYKGMLYTLDLFWNVMAGSRQAPIMRHGVLFIAGERSAEKVMVQFTLATGWRSPAISSRLEAASIK